MEGSPDCAENHTGRERGEVLLQPGQRVAAPSDFLAQACDQEEGK